MVLNWQCTVYVHYVDNRCKFLVTSMGLMTHRCLVNFLYLIWFSLTGADDWTLRQKHRGRNDRCGYGFLKLLGEGHESWSVLTQLYGLAGEGWGNWRMLGWWMYKFMLEDQITICTWFTYTVKYRYSTPLYFPGTSLGPCWYLTGTPLILTGTSLMSHMNLTGISLVPYWYFSGGCGPIGLALLSSDSSRKQCGK